MPLNRTNQTVFGTVTQYALANQAFSEPMTRWYGLNSQSLAINPYGYITGTGAYGTSTTSSPQFDLNGNFTVSYGYFTGEVQTNSLKIGTTNNTENYISFRGTTGDTPGSFDSGFIGERLYGGTEASELLLFKGNDYEGTAGPDRIRLFASNLVFDTFTSPNAVSGTFASVGSSAAAVTRMIIKQNGNIGIGTITPDTIGTSSAPAMLGIVSNLVGTVGLVVKSTSGQTANIQEWKDSAATNTAYINPLLQYFNPGRIAIIDSNFSGILSVFSGNAAAIVSIFRGAASQTADLAQWQNSSGTVLASINSGGRLAATNIYTPTIQATGGGNGAYLSLTVNSTMTATTLTTTVVPLTVKGIASQTANLQEWQDSAGTVLAKVDKDGNLTATNHSDSGWVTPTLSNSFVSGGTTPGYRLLNGVVYLRGNLNNGIGAATAFTLPVGYRPAQGTVIAVQKFGTADFTYLTINADGTVQPSHSSAWLSGASFPVG